MTLTSEHGPVDDYEPRPGALDELVDDAGAVRSHWVGIADEYRAMGLTDLQRRRTEVRRLLEQDGVTYNVATEQGRPQRPWALDPIPLVIPGDEWQALERGVIQRAQLLDLVLTDLYGERRLLRSGAIPAAMILSDPQFSRECDGISLASTKQLIICGTDLIRAGDGAWLALGHRTQAPSGAAYALENRRVLSRVFPAVYRNAEVQRLAPYVRSLRTALQSVAPAGVDDPNIVILSPGARSETAFEHAAIAAQLGYPLVQGSDLEVRDGLVSRRTVDGFDPVHVILRRVDAWFCDPLEFRADSTLGIPGLVEACRIKAVSVVNTLGSGILENAGLSSLLPSLARLLLDEELLLHPVESWWCGEASARSHVVANLGALVVRPLSRTGLGHSVDTTRASADELDALRRSIEAQPEQWVGQTRIDPPTAPVLTDDGLEPRATVLRTFAVAAGDTYVAMKGGLARTAGGDPAVPIAQRSGAISKDTWVLGGGLESDRDFWLAAPDHAIRATREVPSARVAENLFWLGRYAERAESTVRLLRAVNTRRDEFENAPAGPGPAAVAVLLEALTRVTGTFPGFVGDDAAALLHRPADELFALVVDHERLGTVAHAVQYTLEIVDDLRDQLSVDTSLMLASLQRELDHLEGLEGDRDDALTSVLNELLQGLLALAGLTAESMVRDHAWHFIDAGRRIERGMQVTSLVGATLGFERTAATESLLLESVLHAAESIITYRRRYRSHALPSTVFELLFADRGNPRSLRFQLDRLVEDLAVLEAGRNPDVSTLVAGLIELLDATAHHGLAVAGMHGHRVALEAFTATVRQQLSAISDALAVASFTRPLPQHAVVTPVDRTAEPQ